MPPLPLPLAFAPSFVCSLFSDAAVLLLELPEPPPYHAPPPPLPDDVLPVLSRPFFLRNSFLIASAYACDMPLCFRSSAFAS